MSSNVDGGCRTCNVGHSECKGLQEIGVEKRSWEAITTYQGLTATTEIHVHLI